MPEFGTIKLYVSFESSVGKMLLNKSGKMAVTEECANFVTVIN